MAPIFTGNRFGFGGGAAGAGGPVTISYYPVSSPTTITTVPAPSGFSITTEGEFVMTVSSPFTAPFIMWGAGGSRGNDNVSGGGGAGGCSSGTISLTSGTNYVIVVGGNSAQVQFASPFGAGGPGGGPVAFGGAGGGYSAIFNGTKTQPTTLIMAGGGGGGNGTDAGSQPGSYFGGGGGGTGFGQTIPGSFQGGTGGTRGVNQGSGGGGGSGANYAGGNGGSGIVIASYVNLTQRATGGTVTSFGTGASTTWVHSFTTSGTFTA